MLTRKFKKVQIIATVLLLTFVLAIPISVEGQGRGRGRGHARRSAVVILPTPPIRRGRNRFPRVRRGSVVILNNRSNRNPFPGIARRRRVRRGWKNRHL